mmetsp:Transcript_13441/g.18393  ORF Transcript_13441/g.18393 Transcript_13441/m.18393 type:complete len:109 (+) Transcript_13441:139-465(+)|eukprot:CAMPEP_0196581356 /NCGR_PEP_ID=MMETSP1081-20130531/33753_1 /TAXON_ID=36882 /ORGANISM="Pyramimonas amylifera, Strain CCMP720" /LENGTH=108 /DNA_ID=CAMNT_0041901559 /DNA_START=129 /DNA_END=455 /DNA_ORIENTATION=+
MDTTESELFKRRAFVEASAVMQGIQTLKEKRVQMIANGYNPLDVGASHEFALPTDPPPLSSFPSPPVSPQMSAEQVFNSIFKSNRSAVMGTALKHQYRNANQPPSPTF